mmetsp:Transcript_100240/g.323418  ORF Transcript_100240/g.323418 Transcript_100240/m.323418 type:complete len:284 (-) Transcript_100240:792-1643(-)
MPVHDADGRAPAPPEPRVDLALRQVPAGEDLVDLRLSALGARSEPPRLLRRRRGRGELQADSVEGRRGVSGGPDLWRDEGWQIGLLLVLAAVAGEGRQVERAVHEVRHAPPERGQWQGRLTHGVTATALEAEGGVLQGVRHYDDVEALDKEALSLAGVRSATRGPRRPRAPHGLAARASVVGDFEAGLVRGRPRGLPHEAGGAPQEPRSGGLKGARRHAAAAAASDETAARNAAANACEPSERMELSAALPAEGKPKAWLRELAHGRSRQPQVTEEPLCCRAL